MAIVFVLGDHKFEVADGSMIRITIIPPNRGDHEMPTTGEDQMQVDAYSSGEIIAEYERYMTDRRTQHYATSVISMLRTLCEHSGCGLESVNRRHVEAYCSSGSIKASSRNNKLSAIRAFYNWAKRAELLSHNPAENIDRWRQDRQKKRAFTLDEVQALIRVAREDEASEQPKVRKRNGERVLRADFYRFLAITAMRKTEALVLRWRNFELDAEPPRVTLPAGLTRKAGKGRVVVLTKEDATWLAEARQGRLLGDRDDLVFEEPSWRVIHQDIAMAGVEELDHLGRKASLHSFRRFAATHLAMADVHPKVAQMRLGHANLKTTLDIYTDTEQLKQTEAANLLSWAVEKKKIDLASCYMNEGSAHCGGVENYKIENIDLRNGGEPDDTAIVRPTESTSRGFNETLATGAQPGECSLAPTATPAHADGGRLDGDLCIGFQPAHASPASPNTHAA